MKKGTFFTTIGSVIILIISFIAFVLPSQLKSGKEDIVVFGKYDGREVRYEKDSPFIYYAQTYLNNYKSQYQQEPGNQDHFQIFKQAFASSIRQFAFENAAKESGYFVPETSLNRKLANIFLDANGKFDKSLYLQADQDKLKEYKNDLRSSTLNNMVRYDLFGSEEEILGYSALYGLKESDSELTFFTNLDSEKRGFNLVIFPKSEYPEAERLSFGEKNKAKFTSYDLSVITFEEKSDADKVLAKISKNEMTFEEAKTSDKAIMYYANSEGKLASGWKYQYQLEKILENPEDVSVIANLAKGSVSDSIPTSFGYSIFLKDGDNVPADFTADDTKRALSNYIFGFEQTMIEDYFVAKGKEFKQLAEKTDFNSAAAAFADFKAETSVIEPFPLNYGNVSLAATLDTSKKGLYNADMNEQFLKSAFTLKANEISDPIVMSDYSTYGYVVLIQYTPSETNDYDGLSSDQIDEELEFQNSMKAYYVSQLDNMSCTNTILKDPKTEDNFQNAYYSR
ncbi:MAG: SurA N-terminal domain-containing protein [Treponema sp.]|nr:SurA N-terminal domain-containing protein [Treponema sp.]